MDTPKTFLDAAAHDPRIARRPRHAAEGREGREVFRALAAHARGAGYDVGADDVAAFDRAMRGDAGLSAGEIEGIAGGGPLKDVSSWLDGTLATVKTGIGPVLRPHDAALSAGRGVTAPGDSASVHSAGPGRPRPSAGPPCRARA